MSALKSLCSSVVEHFLGKEEVGSPILLKGSLKVFVDRLSAKLKSFARLKEKQRKEIN
jgi:hypothetical protein